MLIGLMNPVTMLILAVSWLLSAHLSKKGHTESLEITFAVSVTALSVLLIRSALISIPGSGISSNLNIVNGCRYLRSYADFSNFITPRAYETVLLNTLLFPLGLLPVASFRDLTILQSHTTGWSSIVAYLHVTTGPLFLCCFLMTCFLAARARPRPDQLSRLLTAFILGSMVFTLWFNPRETFLYSPTVIGPFLLLLNRSMQKETGVHTIIVLAITVAVAAIHNVTVQLAW